LQKKPSDSPAAQRRAKVSSSSKAASAPRQAKAGNTAPPTDAAQDAEPAQAVRIIKKYPNRRLYDTKTSTYITLADVRELVMGRSVFVVRDAKTNEDLTRSILLQIILEEEAGGAPMFTEQVLANIIRFYGNAMQGFMGTYLEKNIQTLMELQGKFAEQSKGLSPEAWSQLLSQQTPMVSGVMGTYMEQSKQLFSQMQEQLHKQGEQMLSSFGLKR